MSIIMSDVRSTGEREAWAAFSSGSAGGRAAETDGHSRPADRERASSQDRSKYNRSWKWNWVSNRPVLFFYSGPIGLTGPNTETGPLPSGFVKPRALNVVRSVSPRCICVPLDSSAPHGLSWREIWR